MKSKTLVILILVSLLYSCETEEDNNATTLIGNETFTPTESTINNNGIGVSINFYDDDKNIEIITSDVQSGEYSITQQSLKSNSINLFANIIYTDGDVEYIGTSGSVTLTNNEGILSGVYDAILESEDNVIIEISSGSFENIEVPAINYLTSENDIIDTTNNCLVKLTELIEQEYILDAVYSNTTEAPNANWGDFYTHEQTSSNEIITEIWNKAWDVIRQCNLLMISTENIISDDVTANELNAQALSIRSYAYFFLLKWFEAIPIFTELKWDENIEQQPSGEVKYFIINDLLTALNIISSDNTLNLTNPVNQHFIRSLLSRFYAYSENYNESSEFSNNIIESGYYSLNSTNNIFANNSTETIWGFVKSDNNVFNNFFNKGEYIPVMRLTESILLYAESQYRLGNIIEATNSINTIKDRNQETNLQEASSDAIYSMYMQELSKEGQLYEILKRFEKLGPLNISEWRLILPIPQSTINKYPTLAQNPGY